ncbi:MAG: argininosuccinate lyase [Geminicoccaceae bacterium]|nr:MAG: argininosuccinate lyase [Geminicoccaceae bacterium]
MERLNASIGFDQRLWRQDIAGSKAHATMLAAQGIITDADRDQILQGLAQIEEEIAQGRFAFKAELEDIHFNVESRLTDLIGEPGRRLHTARSRNDQVATDFRLFVRDAIDRADQLLSALQAVLIDHAEAEATTVMPGFTHLQTAQPVTLGHHLLAYVEMFGRDRSRFQDARARMNESPLGAAALAGTSFAIDREMTAKALGFDRPAANSLDAVSDRDFALDYLSAASITAVHLSRLAEEIVLWATRQFGFVIVSEAFSTGSSIMPQKRNPDAAELIRGKTGRVVGALVSLLTMLKGLPLTYSKDMQEDKEPLFDTVDTLDLCLETAAAMLREVRFDRAKMAAAAGSGFSTATDLADWCVRSLDLPFRTAHHVAGRAVREAEQRNCGLEDLPLDVLQTIEPRITADVFAILGVDNSVQSRTSFGGTAPTNVKAAVREARARFLERRG